MPNDDNESVIAETPRDRALELIRSVASIAPGIGPVIADVVLSQIPGQRLERFQAYMQMLEKRLDVVEEELLRERLQDPASLDLFEEGAEQSVRATTSERIDRIARLVAHGLSGDDTQRIQAKRLLALLEQVDDDQLIILTAMLSRHWDDEEFREKHSAILDPLIAFMDSTPEEIDRATVYELTRNELVRLGLLRPKYKIVRKGEIPEIDDKTGMPKSSGRELTPLGRLLLKRVGLAEDGEY